MQETIMMTTYFFSLFLSFFFFVCVQGPYSHETREVRMHSHTSNHTELQNQAMMEMSARISNLEKLIQAQHDAQAHSDGLVQPQDMGEMRMANQDLRVKLRAYEKRQHEQETSIASLVSGVEQIFQLLGVTDEGSQSRSGQQTEMQDQVKRVEAAISLLQKKFPDLSQARANRQRRSDETELTEVKYQLYKMEDKVNSLEKTFDRATESVRGCFRDRESLTEMQAKLGSVESNVEKLEQEVCR